MCKGGGRTGLTSRAISGPSPEQRTPPGTTAQIFILETWLKALICSPSDLAVLPQGRNQIVIAQYGPAAPLMLPSVPTLAQEPGLYLPSTAAVFAAARFFKACWAAALFTSLPSQVTMQVF